MVRRFAVLFLAGLGLGAVPSAMAVQQMQVATRGPRFVAAKDGRELTPDAREFAALSRRETLSRYISVLEQSIGKPAILNVMPTQEGEMTRTEADVTETRAALGYEPGTPIDVGVKRFVDWYRDFYGV